MRQLFIALGIYTAAMLAICFLFSTRAHADCGDNACMHETTIRPIQVAATPEPEVPVDRYDVKALQNDPGVLVAGPKVLIVPVVAVKKAPPAVVPGKAEAEMMVMTSLFDDGKVEY